MDDSLQQQSFEFALSIVRLYKKLQARQELIISPQLLRSGTRIGLLIEEAFVAPVPQQSKQIDIAKQEARETYYWLRLLQASRLADVDVTPEITQVKQLLHLIAERESPRESSGKSSSKSSSKSLTTGN
ncbi:four helix bundle protein [Leptolyngbya sp. FACHB-711]|uniref:four helix bundle protein n=1 Tax=unclassified Leptolyngbya TaxID=2650499 RepID=UPI001688CA95|nr:four helix bundle protein [Leptolyngbya sp. FACHB-711]MBD1850435.1 four helix bundle protein [Cyanobacteria bacterium FACHB-502]MBD2027006.1 four helix bundle protein [Leptolyngbya sp. FACHB-711]